MKKIIRTLLASVAVLVAGNGVARADVGQMVNIDIQGGLMSGTGVGPILTNGHDFYDSFADPEGGTYDNFVTESSGSMAFGTFTYSSDAMTAINPDDGTSSNMGGTAYAKLFDGYMNADNSITLTVGGLDADATYIMVVYAQREVGQNTELYINGTQVIDSPGSDLSVLTEATALNMNGNYAYVTGLTSNSSGELSFDYQGQISGFQIKELEPVPEPASVVLLGVGGLLGAIGLRRSREKSAA